MPALRPKSDTGQRTEDRGQRTEKIRLLLWLCPLSSVLCLLAAAAALAGPGDDPVVVALRPQATAEAADVTVGQVAAVSGGPAELRRRVAALDVAALSGTAPAVLVSRDQVAYRLRLAGLEPADFRLEGARAVLVRPAHRQLTEDDLAGAAREFLLRRAPWPAQDVALRLAQPVDVPDLPLGPDDKVRFEPELADGRHLLGTVSVTVGVVVNGERRAAVPVLLELRLYQTVAVTTRRVERGEALTKDNLVPDRRPLDGSAQYLTFAEGAAGKRAKRALQPGQALTAADAEAGAEEGAVLIRPRQVVKLVARSGGLRVSALGEAMEEGRAGQIIRVRNVDSKAVVHGRVTEAGVVEVEF